jgi:hypothetical protein
MEIIKRNLHRQKEIVLKFEAPNLEHPAAAGDI